MSIGISALQGVQAGLDTTQLDAAAPSPQSVAHFEAALDQGATPEDKLVDSLQASEKNQQKPLLDNLSQVTQSGEMGPRELLNIQVASMKWVLGVEVGSKVAGSVNQSINKLTSMQ